jgi:flagellar hook-length control protein FliK
VNSSGTSPGGLRGAMLPLERGDEEARHERDGEQAASLWVALAQQVTTVQVLPLGEIEPTNAWHPSAGVLTPSEGASGASEAAPAEPSKVDRMTLRVDGGALGELEVTLERQGGALQVVIGMENQQLVGSVLPDASALRSALEAAGVNLQSLNVVTKAEVGTVLAQRRLSLSGQETAAEQSSETDPEKTQKRSSKRLTLIG